MAASRRWLSSTLVTTLVLAGAGGACWWGAYRAVDYVERESYQAVRAALDRGDKDWVKVTTDGLNIHLSGTAPTEVDRFRAMSLSSTVVDSGRLIDDMTLAAVDALTPPAFKVELLRNDTGISIIGLLPAASDRAALIRTLRTETGTDNIVDLLETTDFPVPENWESAVQFGLRVAQMVPHAKISIEPGAVTVSAITDSRADKGRLETALNRAVPKGVALTTNISAPRPVISPFTLRFLIDDQGARFDACAADTEEGQATIVAAAKKAGVEGIPGCTLGLGAPTPRWAEGAAAAIDAISAMGAGTVSMSDADIHVTAPASVERKTFDDAMAKLGQSLPPIFSLTSELQAADEPAKAEPVEFIADLTSNQKLTMQGGITDARMQETVNSFARSRFAEVKSGLHENSAVPAGWTVRVIGALEALDSLDSGKIKVTPDMISLSGISGDPEANETAAALLSERLGAGANYELAIRYDRYLDPSLNLPDGDECVRQLNIIMSEAEIGFEPSKSTIAGDPDPTLERLAAVMVECADYQLEAGGHTDSQGSEAFNADLSRGRARALVAAMQDVGINVSNMTSRGYGEGQPIANNDTEEGREENRRIEFRLLSQHPVRPETTVAPLTREGTTAEVAKRAAEPEQTADEKLLETIAAAATQAGQVALPSKPTAQPEFFGPPLPKVITVGVPPSVVGASEEFQPMDVREENLTVPVQTPDADTPRPTFRPDSVLQNDEPNTDQTTE